jgi:hypothetical protein
MNIRVALKSVGIVLLAMAFGSMGWSQEKTSLPEFFGFYALDGGQNVALYEGQGSESAKSAGIEWYSIPQNSKLQDTRPQVSTSARFVLFYTNSGEMIQSLSLHRLPFVRQIIETLPADAFSPPSRRVIDSPKLPLLAAIPELNFRLLAKPVPNQPQMVELVASPQLTPGLYVVQYSPSGANGWFAIFSVAASAEAESPFCLDLVLPGGPRGLFERANSELNSTVPALASYRYTKCDMSTAPNATAVSGVNSGGSNAAVSDPTELIATWDRALGLGQTISIPLCRDRGGFSNKDCEPGTLSLSPTEVSFEKSDGQKFLAAPPSQTKFRRDPNFGGSGVFSLTIGGKYSRFLYVAQGVDCPDRTNGFPVCPAGFDQQNTVSDWVDRAIKRLASGGSNGSIQK